MYTSPRIHLPRASSGFTLELLHRRQLVLALASFRLHLLPSQMGTIHLACLPLEEARQSAPSANSTRMRIWSLSIFKNLSVMRPLPVLKLAEPL